MDHEGKSTFKVTTQVAAPRTRKSWSLDRALFGDSWCLIHMIGFFQCLVLAWPILSDMQGMAPPNAAGKDAP